MIPKDQRPYFRICRLGNFKVISNVIFLTFQRNEKVLNELSITAHDKCTVAVTADACRFCHTLGPDA